MRGKPYGEEKALITVLDPPAGWVKTAAALSFPLARERVERNVARRKKTREGERGTGRSFGGFAFSDLFIFFAEELTAGTEGVLSVCLG